MIKKKVIGLSMLLLVLLLGLSTTCYAKELTATQIKNFMLNYIDNFYEGETYYQTYRQRIINMDISGWVNGISGKQGTYLLSATGNGQYLYFYYFCWRPTNNNYAYISTQNGYPIIRTNDTSIQFRNRFDVFNNTLGYDNANLFLANADGSLFNYYYIDGNIYSNSNKTEITYPAGTYYPNETIFDSQYIPTPSQHFSYAASVLQSRDINLNGSYNFSETAQEILFDYNPFSGNEINAADSVITGYLWDADLFSKAIFTEYAYNYTTGKFEYDGKYWESTNIGNVHDNMIWVEFLAKDYGTLYKPDTILHAEFQCNTTDYDFIYTDFYIRSPYSAIRNQVLYPGETFSGDYALIYNDNQNTDKIINNTNDSSEVEAILGNFASGDYQEVAEKFGFVFYDNTYYSIISNIIESLVTTLEQTGDVYFEFQKKDNTRMRIYSSQFYVPDDHPIKIFTSWFLVACTVYVFYLQIATIIELISTGSIVDGLRNLMVDRDIFKM